MDIIQQYLNYYYPRASHLWADMATMESYILGLEEIDEKIIPKCALKRFSDGDFISVDTVSSQIATGKSVMGIELWDHDRTSLAFLGVYVDNRLTLNIVF